MLKKLSVLVAITALLGLLSGQIMAQSSLPVNLGNVRAVNALVGVGPVDVYLDHELMAYNLPPEQASAYVVFPAGVHNMIFRLAGSDPLSTPVAIGLFELSPNQSQTGIGYQTEFSTDESSRAAAEAGKVLFLSDDRSPLQLGKTRVTAAHLAPGTPGHLSIGYPSRASLLYQIPLEQPFGSIDIEAGLYSLAVVDADDPSLAVLSRAGDKSLYANTLYTMVIVPDIAPPENGDLPVLSTQPRMFLVSAPVEPPQDGIRLRIVHAAHNTAVVDVYIDERLVARRVNYGLSTEYLGLTKYSHTITLRNFGSPADSPPLARADFIIDANNKDQPTWSLLLVNATGDTSIGLPVGRADPNTNTPAPTTFATRGEPMMMTLLPDDLSKTRRGYSRIRLIHALDGFPALSLFGIAPSGVSSVAGVTPNPAADATPAPPLEFVRQTIFGSEPGETEIRSGFYNQLDIRIALSSSTITSLNNLQFIDGLVYTFVIIGSNSGAPPLKVIWYADYGNGTQTNRLYSGRIRGALVNIRQESRAGSQVVTTLPKDWDVDVLSRNIDASWIRIRFNDATTGAINEGWISADLVLVTRLGTVINPQSLPQYTGVE